MSAHEATRLVLRCVVQGVLVMLVMSALDPLTQSLIARLSGR